MTAIGPVPPATHAPGPVPPPPGRPQLRRSGSDKYAAGICGGLAEFFGLDPVVFRVLFVALSFAGGLGVAVYLACWIAIPESGAPNSQLDHWIANVRKRNVPLWVVGVAAAIALWVAFFSWWTPLHIIPLVGIAAVLAVAVLALTRRDGATAPAAQPAPDVPMPARPAAADERPTVELSKAESPAMQPWHEQPAPQPPATEPLPAASAQLRDWWEAEHGNRAVRGRRGWITELVAQTLMWGTWGVLALVSLGTPIPLQAFLWSGLGILLAATIVGAAIRRPRWRMLVGVGFLAAALLAIGTYTIRVGDPTGQRDASPSSVADIDGTYRMFAGEQLLDFSAVDFDGRTVSVKVRQGAGHVKITVPQDVAVVVDADARYGQLDIFGDGFGGVHNEHDETYPAVLDPTDAGTLRLDVSMLAGDLQIVRG
jgi:phage shock protein PspC (stress-responsive transcriptional regulator)